MSNLKIGKSSISHKVLCIVMAISLSLMMLPSALFKTQANAAEAQDENRVKAADLFKFSYAENSNSANKTTLTQADLLDVLNNRPVDIDEVKAQKAAETELKVQLDKANLFLEPNEALIPKEGFVYTAPNVEALTLRDAATNKLNGHIYFAKDDQTKNFDVTTSNVAENLSGAVDVAINYAQWDATYEVYFSNSSVAVPVSTEWTEVDATTAIIKYRFSSTGNVANGKPTYNLETSIQVKNNTQNPTTFTANIEKIQSASQDNESQPIAEPVNENAYVVDTQVVLTDQHVGDSYTFENTQVFKSDYTESTISSATIPETVEGVSCDLDTNNKIKLTYGSTVIASDIEFNITVAGTLEDGVTTFEEALSVKIAGGLTKILLTPNFSGHLADNSLNPAPMREAADNNAKVFDALNNFIVTDSTATEEVQLVFTSQKTSSTLLTYTDIDPVEDLTAQVNLAGTGVAYDLRDSSETSWAWKYELSSNTFNITISKPTEYTNDIYIYDGDGTGPNKNWNKVNKEGNLIKADISNAGTIKVRGTADSFAAFANPLASSTPDGDNHQCNFLVKLTSDNIIQWKTSIIKLDQTAPQYTTYVVADADAPDTQTGNWFIDVLNGIKFLFSKNDIVVKFYVSDNLSKFDEAHAVYLGTQAEPDVALTPNTEKTCWEYVVKNENPSDSYDFDIKQWKISAVDVAGNIMEKRSPVPVDPGDLVTKVVGKTPGPSSVSYVWNEEDTEVRHDIPTDISGKTQTLDIKVSDDYFKYSEQYFQTNKDDSTINKNVVTIKSTKYTLDHPEGVVQDTVYKRLSDIENNILPCDFAPIANSYVTYTVSVAPITDGLGRKASGDEGLESVTFGVLAIGPSIQNVVWTPDEKTPEANEWAYYNVPRKATIDVIYFGTQDTNVLDNYINLGLNSSEGHEYITHEWTKSSEPYKFQVEITYGTVDNKSEGKCDMNISRNEVTSEFEFDVTFVDAKFRSKAFVQDFKKPNVEITWADAVAPSRENFELAGVGYVDYYNQYKDSQKVANVKLTENYWDSNAFNLGFPQKTLDALAGTFSDFYGEGDYAINWIEPSSGAEANVYNATISFDDDHHHEFSVNGEDLAGNPADVTVNNTDRKFVLDSKAPEITFSWKGQEAPNYGRYFSLDKDQILTAQIVVEEHNFYGDFMGADDGTGNPTGYFTYEFTNNERTSTSVKKIDCREDTAQWSHNGDIHTLEVTFFDEGDYNFSFEGEDIARNNLVWSETQEDSTFVTIDKTAPTGRIDFDNNNVVNGKYYTGPRTATITIDERNFFDDINPTEIFTTPQVIVGHDGSRGYFDTPSAWSHSNNDTVHTMTIHFPVEGTYVITVEGKDLATKALTPLSSGEFVIDWTQPNINISGVADHQAYGDVISPVVTINDANMSPQTTCQVNNLGITKGNPFQTSPAASDAQYTYSYPNPANEPDNDGVYRITVNAYDMAGNTSTQTLAWSVNRFGSTYVIDAETEKMMGGYVNNESIVDVKVTEINPSNIEQKHVEMTKGSFTETLNEGQDYTASVSGGGDSWVQCEYVIEKGFFKEDSRYTINYLSKDAAGNDNDNTMENKNPERNAKVNVQFMLDNAKPTCFYNNLSEDLINKSNHEASVTFEDNSKEFEFAKVTIDGDETYVDGEKLKKDNDYELGFTLTDSAAPHQITVESTDKAGNKMEVSHKSVVVSTNPFVLWFYNTPLFVGTLVVIVAIAGGLIWWFVRRRKVD